MNEINQTAASTVAPTQSQSGAYKGARDVQVRAAVTKRSDPPAVEKAIDRLDQVLASGSEPNRNVPRGYYLNITV